MAKDESALKIAWWLSVATVVYNIAEGIISVAFGINDEALTLLGFGLDSFIETISASGILYMVVRLRRGEEGEGSEFERQALRITGWSFYALSVVLTIGAVLNVIYRHNPESTLAGIIISLISIILMILLVHYKRKIGKRLNSRAIVADANCNLVCIYMSVVLLASSFLYEVFAIPYIDAIGTMGLVYFSVREGKEALEHARTGACGCH